MAVNRFTGATSNAWTTPTNWSQGTVPTASDGHVTTFDATSPNCTIASGSRNCNNIDFTGYTNTITMTGVTLAVSGNITLISSLSITGTPNLKMSSNGTLTSNSFVWPGEFSLAGAITCTLSGNFEINGAFYSNGNNVLNKTTSETLKCSGLGSASGPNATSGTAKIILKGGTWDGANSSAWANDIDIQGNVTFSGTCQYKTGTLKYVSGTVTVTSSTLSLTGSCTLDTTGLTWNNATFTNSSGQTYTVNSTLSASGTLTLGTGAATTFAGTSGFNCATLSNSSTGSSTITLANTVTYTVTSSLSCFSSRVGSIVLFTSDHATNKTILTLTNGATCNCLADFTRIDSSNGRPIRTFKGTLTDCLNIVSISDLITVGSIF